MAPTAPQGEKAPRPAVLNSTDQWLEQVVDRLDQLLARTGDAPSPAPTAPPAKKAASAGKTVVKGD